MLIHAGRLPLLAAEHAAVDKLIAKHPDAPVSLTRRDADETGPLLVHVGDDSYLVDVAGRTRKQRTR